MVEQKRGEMTVKEAGRLGGESLKASLGADYSDHFREIGKQGSQALREKMGGQAYLDWLKEIAPLGGQEFAKTHSHEDFVKRGRTGGTRLRDSKEPGYFAEIGRKGALSPKRRGRVKT